MKLSESMAYNIRTNKVLTIIIIQLQFCGIIILNSYAKFLSFVNTRNYETSLLAKLPVSFIPSIPYILRILYRKANKVNNSSK